MFLIIFSCVFIFSSSFLVKVTLRNVTFTKKELLKMNTQLNIIRNMLIYSLSISPFLNYGIL